MAVACCELGCTTAKQLAYQVPAPAQSGLTLTEAEQLLPIQQRFLPLEKKLHRHR